MARARLKMNFPLCSSQIACDGDPIKTGREMCCACERTVEKRNKIVKALRGQRYVDYNIERMRNP